MQRIKALDALRGLAATAVVFSHLHDAFFVHHIFLDLTPVRFFWTGGEAVIFFFVLSGFVLSAPYLSTGNVPFAKFFVTRLTRIYLPYLVAILICLFFSASIYNLTAAHTHLFIEKRWPHPIAPNLLGNHLLLIGDFDTTTYDEVIWSLVHEMRLAIVFPAFIWLLMALSLARCLIVAASLSLVAAMLTTLGVDESVGFKSSYLYSIHYLLFFLIGGLLAKHRRDIEAQLTSLTRKQVGFLLGLALALYVYSNAMNSVPKALHWKQAAQFGEFLADWGVGIASAIFVALAICDHRVAAFLNAKVFVFLGKISFSLYLVHIPILAAAFHIFPAIPEVVTVLAALPFILGGAVLFHELVEAPSHRLGRKLFQGGRMVPDAL